MKIMGIVDRHGLPLAVSVHSVWYNQTGLNCGLKQPYFVVFQIAA